MLSWSNKGHTDWTCHITRL